MRNLILFLSVLSLSSYPKIRLEFINDVEFSSNVKINKQLFGGLSGITKISENEYYAISDDRGNRGTPRFFKLNIREENSAIKIVPKSWVELKDKNGKSYKEGTIDFEGISSLSNGNLLISTEGDLRLNPRIKPEILEYRKNGTFVRNWQVPAHFFNEEKGKVTRGVRFNSGFESMAYDLKSKMAFTLNETILFQDGKIDVKKGLPLRLLTLKNGKVVDESRYELSPVPNPRGFKSLKGDNGAVDILALSGSELLVVERSFLKNNYENTIKIFKVDLDKTQNSRPFYVHKELVADLSEFIPKFKGRKKLDNIEGICFGPTLKSGERTIIVVSDNNFSSKQRTLFLAFKLVK